MLERDMYPIFEKWLLKNSDIFMQEPLIPAQACFDFIAFKDGFVTVYELKVSNAKKVIQQANMSLLWCDHSYAVLPKDKVHLGLKYQEIILPFVGLISLDMEDGSVEVIIEPKIKRCHFSLSRLRQYMIDWMIRDWIYRHRCYVDRKRSKSRARVIQIENKRLRKGK